MNDPLQAFHATAEEPLAAAASALPETAAGEFMWMAGGLHTVNVFKGPLGGAGKPVQVEVLVDRNAADAMQQQLRAVQSRTGHDRPYFDFNHEDKEASFWPEAFNWKDSPAPGVYVRGEWSSAGRAAVEGKMYRAFSPVFRVDDEKKKPARIRCSERASLNFGGLVNDPAFKHNLPFWAKRAGEPGVANTEKHTMLTKDQLATLQAQKSQLTEEINAIEAQGFGTEETKVQLMARKAQLVSVDAQIESEELRARNQQLEQAQIESRTKEAKAAVAKAVARGAIPAKDEELQARWVKRILENPEDEVLLASARGHVALTTPSAPASRISITQANVSRESNEHVLRAMSSLQLKQTPDTAYEDKRNIAREVAALYAREILPRLKEGDDIPLRGSNSFGTLSATMVSIRTLELLTLTFPLLKSIFTDFSDSIVNYGDTLKTRTVAIPTVQTFNTSTGWPTNSDHVTSDVSITYDQFKGVPISIIASDLASTVRRLFDEIAPAQAYALGKDMVDFVYALITAAFTNTVTSAGLGTFGRSTVIDVGGVLDDAANPEMGRTLLLNRPYYSALAKDQTIITLAAFQKSEIIERGVLPDVEGFRVIKAVNLPATAISGKVLKGFGFTRSALVLATRLAADYVNALPGAGNGNLTVVTTPGGFSANQVQYVNHSAATANQRLEVIYGAARGQVAAGALLTDV